MRNWITYQFRSDKYFYLISQFLSGYGGKYFRWHVGGDIPDEGYLTAMCTLAHDYNQIQFACWTKQYEFDYTNLPLNLNIILSCWPGLSLPKNIFLSRSWYQDGSETRIPSGGIKCHGHCPECMLCWKHSTKPLDIIHYKKKQLRLFHPRKKA
jgi:hypothetical protein